MELQKVLSSTIEAIGYNSQLQTLCVMFKDGKLFEYSNVKATEYEAFLRSPSKGAFFSKFIKIKPSKQLPRA